MWTWLEHVASSLCQLQNTTFSGSWNHRFKFQLIFICTLYALLAYHACTHYTSVLTAVHSWQTNSKDIAFETISEHWIHLWGSTFHVAHVCSCLYTWSVFSLSRARNLNCIFYNPWYVSVCKMKANGYCFEQCVLSESSRTPQLLIRHHCRAN